MNYTDYIVVENAFEIVSIIRSDGCIIPTDMKNSDYQQFIEIDTPEHLCERRKI